MKEFRLSTLTESRSFQRASEGTKDLVLRLFDKATLEMKKQALRLCESASTGDEIRAVITYLTILNSPSYLSNSRRVTPLTLPMTDKVPEEKITELQDDLKGYRVTSQVLEVINQHSEGICRKGILDALKRQGINYHSTAVGEALSRLKKRDFIWSEERSSIGRKGRYHYYFINEKVEAIEPASNRQIRVLLGKGYSITEIALRIGLSRDTVAAQCAKKSRSKRKAS